MARTILLCFEQAWRRRDVSPLVTVKLTGLTFQPLTTLLFGASFDMPTISASLTGEDLSGTTGN
jgi:hypothetical protein